VTTYSGAQTGQGATKPLRTMHLPPSAFKDAVRPPEPRLVGLRLPSEGDLQTVRCEAVRKLATSLKGVPTSDDVWIEAYNQEVMLLTISAVLCHPDDSTRDYWENAQRTVVRNSLTQGGCELLWDELELLKLKTAPTAPQASDDDIDALCTRLADPDFASHLPPGDTRALRRILRHCLDILEAYDSPPETPIDE